MTDSTEHIRRALVAEINSNRNERAGQTWDTAELGRDFEVLGFMAPFVVVRRKSDGAKGSLMFQHSPRLYFGWQAD